MIGEDSPPRPVDRDAETTATVVADKSEPRSPATTSRAGLWVSTTYFAEGFPYTIVNTAADVMFKAMDASLQVIGLTALFHLPWNLKFLWAPWLDSHGTKRTWIVGLELILAALLVVLAMTMRSAHVLVVSGIVFFTIGVLAATHDIAIDGYYLEALDERGRSKYVGLRAAAYRASMYAGAAPLFIIAGAYNWMAAWLTAAAAMAAMALYHGRTLPQPQTARTSIRSLVNLKALGVVIVVVMLGIAVVPLFRGTMATQSAATWLGFGLLATVLIGLGLLPRWRRRLRNNQSPYAQAFAVFVRQPKIGRILGLVILFRTGESLLSKMRYPFLADHLGVDETLWGQINLLSIAGGIAATIFGGWLIARHGLRRWLWPFVLAQNALNLLYMGIAHIDDPQQLGILPLLAIVTVEQVGAGLGTAVFLVYIMRCCDPRHKAAHMAILTALMSLGFTFAGAASGYLAGSWGFERYFALSFLATLPSMAILPFAPHLDAREPAEPA